MTNRQLFLLGIDGLPPSAFHRFIDSGDLPNCARLLTQSASVDVVPTLPPLTCPGWPTIASGAHPGTHGVSNILQPVANSRPDRIRNGFDRRHVQAEYIWDVLADEGRPAIVLKYPGSWPPRSNGCLQVDGAGGYADITCEFECVCSALYTCADLNQTETGSLPVHIPEGYEQHWRIDSQASSGAIQVVPRDPLGWSNVPSDAEIVFEVIIPVEVRRERHRRIWYGLAYRMGQSVFLAICPTKDWNQSIARLQRGEWSTWVYGETGDARQFVVRFKLLAIDLYARQFRLYRSEGHQLAGYTQPDSLSSELLERVGPVVEWTGTYDFMSGLVDLETQLEIYEAHTEWLENTIRYLSTKPWHGFFCQWHVVEYAHHIAGASLDLDHPDSKLQGDEYFEFLRKTYRLLDRLVGTVQACLAEDDVLALVSDHGHDLVHTLFFINDFLVRCGWLRLDASGTGIDWTGSQAFALFPGCIRINRKCLWEGGTVDEDEVEKLVRAITESLRGLKDPRTQKNIVTHVIGPDERRAYGQGGENCPDMFFCLTRGYETASRIRGTGFDCFEQTIPGQELTSGHGSFHPMSPSAMTMALFRSSDLLPGSKGKYPIAITDLAPTFSQWLGCRTPQQSDGRPLNFAQLGIAKDAL